LQIGDDKNLRNAHLLASLEIAYICRLIFGYYLQIGDDKNLRNAHLLASLEIAYIFVAINVLLSIHVSSDITLRRTDVLKDRDVFFKAI
jgi:hypothetical protein